MKPIINCNTGNVVYYTPTQEEIEQEKERLLKQQMEIKYEYPTVTEEQELIALQTLEIEDLKDEIQNIKNNIGGM